jgi:hypothetical protein
MTQASKAPEALSRRTVEEKIVALAWKDDGFRRSFLADPKKQFEERLGTTLPASLKMTAHQEDADHLYFVIPARPKLKLDELSDEDLEKVAGGVTPLVVAGTILSAAAVSGLVASASVTVLQSVLDDGKTKW